MGSGAPKLLFSKDVPRAEGIAPPVSAAVVRAEGRAPAGVLSGAASEHDIAPKDCGISVSENVMAPKAGGTVGSHEPAVGPSPPIGNAPKLAKTSPSGMAAGGTAVGGAVGGGATWCAESMSGMTDD